MKIAICDDNVELVRKLSGCLMDKYPAEISRIDSYYDSEEFLTCLTESAEKLPDILIMDICFKDGEASGIYAAEEMQKKYPNLKIIFITGYIQHVPDIFKTRPSFLLMKPIKKDKLFIAFERTLKELEDSRDTYIKVKTRSGVIPIAPREIIYIESNKHDLFICFSGRVEETRMKMDDLVKLLPKEFIRIHQSFTVNAAYVKKITTEGAFLTDGTKLPVSRGRYGETKRQLGRYLLLPDESK